MDRSASSTLRSSLRAGMMIDTRGSGPARGGWSARDRIDRLPRQIATAVARWPSRVTAARARRNEAIIGWPAESHRLPPAENLQRHGEADQPPGEDDGELRGDRDEPP